MSETEKQLRERVAVLEGVLRDAMDEINKFCYATGDVIWMTPPRQAAGVHETLWERMGAALDLPPIRPAPDPDWRVGWERCFEDNRGYRWRCGIAGCESITPGVTYWTPVARELIANQLSRAMSDTGNLYGFREVTLPAPAAEGGGK